MKRRTFLQILGGVVAGVMFNPAKATELFLYPNFNPREEYGDYFVTTDWVKKSDFKYYQPFFDEMIAEIIPKKYRKKIHYAIYSPCASRDDPLGQLCTLTWKYSPRHRGTEVIFI